MKRDDSIKEMIDELKNDFQKLQKKQNEKLFLINELFGKYADSIDYRTGIDTMSKEKFIKAIKEFLQRHQDT